MGSRLRFIHATDPHIAVGPMQVQFGVDTTQSFQRVLAALAEEVPAPDFVLISGDLVADGLPESYEAFRDLVRPLSAPVRLSLGNHDERPAFRRVILGSENGSEDPYCYAFRVAETDFLVLDSHLGGTSAGILDPGQLTWLRNRLGESREAVVCIHHHPVPTGLVWLDRLILWNADELMGILQDNRALRGLIFGHIHRTFEGDLAGAPLLGTPSTCYQFGARSESREISAEPPAYRVITVEDGRMASELRWLDRSQTTTGRA